jgi:hypothetical protein
LPGIVAIGKAPRNTRHCAPAVQAQGEVLGVYTQNSAKGAQVAK